MKTAAVPVLSLSLGLIMLASPTRTRAADDARPVENAAKVTEQKPANPNLPTLWIIGDSTVRNGRGDGGNGQWGWGDQISGYFDTSKINVVNRAMGGRSSRTFYTEEGRWKAVRGEIKKGDFVIMQFGHNDGGAVNDATRARASLKGTGEETQEIDNMLTKQHETVHTFGWYLRQYVREAKEKGATPIVCSLIPRKIWNAGKVARASSDYGKWAADVAKAENVSFVDLNEIIAQRYETLGEEKVAPLFADEHTHTTLEGAKINAEAVIAGLNGLKNNPLQNVLSEQGKAVKPFAPASAGATRKRSPFKLRTLTAQIALR